MPCTCNAICDLDCSSHSVDYESGKVDACLNDFCQCNLDGGISVGFTSLSTGDIVRASHLLELEIAINQERTDTSRRFISPEPSASGPWTPPDYAACDTHIFGDVACSNNAFASYLFTGARGVGDIARASHFDAVIDANNEVVNDSTFGQLIAFDPDVGDVIYAANITDLQTKINQTRSVCICDSHCSCDEDCGCDGECENDDYYYYYYYP